MDTKQYENLRKLAESLEFRLKDKLDDRSQPTASSLIREFNRFKEDVESKKSARSLEHSAKNIRNILVSASNESQNFMDYHDIDFFKDQFEDIIKTIRDFDNY